MISEESVAKGVTKGVTKGLLHQTGGHNLISVKPVFSKDSKYLLIASGRHLRRYVVQTGAFISSQSFGHQKDIISLQLMSHNLDEVMITSSDGFIVIWNMTDNTKVNEYKLQISPNYETILWCQLVANYFYFKTNRFDSKQLNKTKCRLYYCLQKDVHKKRCLDNGYQTKQTTNSVAFCPTSEPRYCVSIHKNYLNVYGIPVTQSSLRRNHLMQSDKQFTCVISHPNEEMIATGDSLGRITIWHDFIHNNHPSRAIHHWHQWPVADLCLSPEGTSLYSVGAEMTLVRWNIIGNHCGQNNFMPRLGMPIKYVTIDDNQHLIVTSHEDNSIQVLGPQMKGIKCVIEGMTSSVGNDFQLFTGLLWNKKMNAIALNGRTGHLQFYSPQLQKQLFQLDVVHQNLISATTEHKVFPTEVTKAAVSADGLWLSTVEMRDDFETLPEIRLKFWELKQTNKNYFLNTTIHLPHKSEVNCLTFASNSQSMVSTGADKEFKVWHLIEDEDKKWWKCSKVGNLNSVSVPTIANWSSDSSLLGIAFNNFITLWDVSDDSGLKLMTKLSIEEKSDSRLIFVDFGNEDKSHCLIEGRQHVIKVWNLLDLSILWSHRTSEPIINITLNKWENKLAVITDKSIDFFKLDSEAVICSVDLTQRMIFGIFSDEMPDNSLDLNCEPLLERTKFYCLSERQELFSFVQNERKSSGTEIMNWNTNEFLSPIALMLTNKMDRKETPNTDDFETYFKTNSSLTNLVNDMFLNVPSHVLPPIDILSKTFLSALNKCHQKDEIKDDKHFKTPSDLDIKPLLAIGFDNQSDVHSNSTNLDTNEREVEIKDILTDEPIDEGIGFVEEDYSWLKPLEATDK